MSKKKNIVMITMLAVVAVMSIAYAYFATNLNITSTGSISSAWDVKFIGITNDTPVGSATNVTTPSYTATTATMSADLKLPGDSITYRITLKNNGDIPAIIEDIDASATGSGAIIYSLTGLNIGDELAGGAEKVIVVKVEYDPTVTSQPQETTKTLTVSIKAVQDVGQTITPSIPNVDQPLDNMTIATAILSHNAVKSDVNVNYSGKATTSTRYKEVHGTTEIAAYTGTVYDLPLSSSYTFDPNTGIYYCGYGDILIYDQTIAEYGDIGDNVYTCGERTTECTTMYKLTGTDGYAYEYTSAVHEVVEDKSSSLFYTNFNTFENKTTYFFRGNVENNYVKFGKWKEENSDVGASVEDDMYWRIVRINEDGSIRLLYQGTDVNSDGEESTIGFGTYANETTCPLGSMYCELYTTNGIRDYVDNWYNINLSSYSNLFVDSGFCMDVSNQLNNWDRLSNENISLTTISFKCPNQITDLLTMPTNTKGTKSLRTPVGLLSADEAIYAGALGYGASNTSNTYLNSGISLLTLTTVSEGGYTEVNSNGVINFGPADGYEATSGSYIRPVINVKGNSLISLNGTGDPGTATNPYIIETN